MKGFYAGLPCHSSACRCNLDIKSRNHFGPKISKNNLIAWCAFTPKRLRLRILHRAVARQPAHTLSASTFAYPPGDSCWTPPLAGSLSAYTLPYLPLAPLLRRWLLLSPRPIQQNYQITNQSQVYGTTGQLPPITLLSKQPTGYLGLRRRHVCNRLPALINTPASPACWQLETSKEQNRSTTRQDNHHNYKQDAIPQPRRRTLVADTTRHLAIPVIHIDITHVYPFW